MLDDAATAKCLQHMRAGHRVLVVAGTVTEAREVFYGLAAHAWDIERVRRANGLEEIRSADGRGWIRFCSVSAPTRGSEFDVIIVAIPELLPLIASSPIGEISVAIDPWYRNRADRGVHPRPADSYGCPMTTSNESTVIVTVNTGEKFSHSGADHIQIQEGHLMVLDSTNKVYAAYAPGIWRHAEQK